jgi:hypothetical protein
VGACAGRSLQVSFQDGRALLSGDFFEPNFFTTTMMQHGLVAGGPDVPDPSSILRYIQWANSPVLIEISCLDKALACVTPPSSSLHWCRSVLSFSCADCCNAYFDLAQCWASEHH